MVLIDVGASEDFMEGEKKVIDANGDRVLLTRFEGKVYALHGKCTHQGADLGIAGKVTGRVLHCRMHGANWDIVTGEKLAHAGATDLKTFEVDESNGRVLVKM
jgi:nitrite reductase/ring-hydroxylating ferredoxin subunit